MCISQAEDEEEETENSTTEIAAENTAPNLKDEVSEMTERLVFHHDSLTW